MCADAISIGCRFIFGSRHMLNGIHVVEVVVGQLAISGMAFRTAGRDLPQKPDVKVARPGFPSVRLALRRRKNAAMLN